MSCPISSVSLTNIGTLIFDTTLVVTIPHGLSSTWGAGGDTEGPLRYPRCAVHGPTLLTIQVSLSAKNGSKTRVLF